MILTWACALVLWSSIYLIPVVTYRSGMWLWAVGSHVLRGQPIINDLTKSCLSWHVEFKDHSDSFRETKGWQSACRPTKYGIFVTRSDDTSDRDVQPTETKCLTFYFLGGRLVHVNDEVHLVDSFGKVLHVGRVTVPRLFQLLYSHRRTRTHYSRSKYRVH